MLFVPAVNERNAERRTERAKNASEDLIPPPAA
jgi:hypothetical protein